MAKSKFEQIDEEISTSRGATIKLFLMLVANGTLHVEDAPDLLEQLTDDFPGKLRQSVRVLLADVLAAKAAGAL